MSDETKDFSVAEFTEGFRSRLSEKPGINTAIKFVFEDGGLIHIDGKSSSNVVSNDDHVADVTLKLSLETMNKLYRKETNGMTAFMSGKVKLEGDMLAAMKLDQILG